MRMSSCVVICIFLCVVASGAAQELPQGLAAWPEEGRGNHRVLLRVDQPADAVRAHIPWRRRDLEPEKKAILVFDAATGQRVANVVPIRVERESGDLAFQPGTVPGAYEFYYLPYSPGKGNFDDAGTYVAPESTSDAAWLERNRLRPEDLASAAWKSLPEASVTELQARGDFHRMDPMEKIATREETQSLLYAHPDKPYLLFPEDRRFPVRMFEDLPQKWIASGPGDIFQGTAQPGEYYTLQIAVWAARQAIDNLSITIHPFVTGTGNPIPQEDITCFNAGGTDWLGHPFSKQIEVGEGQVRPLWFGVQIPRDAQGVCRGEVVLTPANLPPASVRVELRVAGGPLEDGGVNDLARMSRLKWLNSTLGLDEDVVPPFTPLESSGNRAKCLGREVLFDAGGLPQQIRCLDKDLLAAPVAFEVETPEGFVPFSPRETKTLRNAPGLLERMYESTSSGMQRSVQCIMEADGCLAYTAVLKAESPLLLKDIRLAIPLKRARAAYLMGFGQRGGFRKEDLHWKWNVDHADNQLWIGDPEGGLQLTLRSDKNTWDVVTLHDAGLPDGWANRGKGGCDVLEQGDTVLVRAYSGERTMQPGDELRFQFRLLITPFKPIDPRHWNWRYGDVGADANILHIHHATPENPYINYPFLTADKLKETIRQTKALVKHTDLGKLEYPASGNIRLDQGSLDLWVRLNFDPQAGEPRNARYNQNLFNLDFPNGDSLVLYWNVDVRGMRAYTRKGAPEQNQYPSMTDASAPEWKQGERHQITLSWGERLAILIDGQPLGETPCRGLPEGALSDAKLAFSGEGFALEGLKISSIPRYDAGQARLAADDNTLLLETFRNTSAAATQPEKCAGPGLLSGTVRLQQTPNGPELILSSKEIHGEANGVNLYYTVRELSNHVAEMWPLRSLGSEVFTGSETFIYSVEKTMFGKAGGGYPWLQEHLVSGYVPAWRQPLPDGETDAAIGTQGLSRWHNYYVEGMQWLMQNTGLDGLYLDGIGYDREIMKRIAKVMCRNNPGYRINFHSGNNYDFMNWHTSPANSYMEHFPYLSNLWFGEMYDYNLGPDYWLVEISGIPFGLTSEMLNYENGGNPYRGMLYGMTGRLHASASAMWRCWDTFGIQDAEWLGYWNPKCPVKTDRPDVLASVYRKPGAALIALAHWPAPGSEEKTIPVRLSIDWASLGLDPARASLEAPRIDRFQDAATFTPSGEIGVPASKGWLLLLRDERR